MKKLSINYLHSLSILLLCGLSFFGSSWVASFDNQINRDTLLSEFIDEHLSTDRSFYLDNSSSSHGKQQRDIVGPELNIEEEKEEDKLSGSKNSSAICLYLVSTYHLADFGNKLSSVAKCLSQANQSIFSISYKSLLIAFRVIIV